MFERVKEIAWFIQQFERDVIEIVTKAHAYTDQILPLLPETEMGHIIAYDDEREDRRTTKNSKLNASRPIEIRHIRVYWWDRDDLAHAAFIISFTGEGDSRTTLMGEATSRGIISWWHPQDGEPFVALGDALLGGEVDALFLQEYLEMLAEAKEAVEDACAAAVERAEAMRKRKENED